VGALVTVRRDNGVVDVEELPPAAQLWWTAACLAARDRALGRKDWRLELHHQVLRHVGTRGRWLGLQRVLGERFAVWGNDPGDAAPHAWTDVPGWATPEVQGWWEASGATFVAWHARDGWDTVTPEASLAPMQPLLDAHARGIATAADDPRALAELIGTGDIDAARAVLTEARREASTGQGRVRRVLAHEVHAQMSRTVERDRVLPQQPVAVVRWVRAAAPPPGFAFSVHLEGETVLEDASSHQLARQFHASLMNIFALLHRDEADEASGSWLFARVTYDGTRISFERAFDSLPHWYAGESPTLETLAAEMGRRDPRWRPPWARLL